VEFRDFKKLLMMVKTRKKRDNNHNNTDLMPKINLKLLMELVPLIKVKMNLRST